MRIKAPSTTSNQNGPAFQWNSRVFNTVLTRAYLEFVARRKSQVAL